MENTWKIAKYRSTNNYKNNLGGANWNPFPTRTRGILTRRLAALISKTASNLRRKTGSENSIKRNFASQYRNIEAEARENAEFFVVRNKGVRQTPLRSVGRPPLAPRGPRAAAVRNKLVANMRVEHAKLVKARNYYQKEANKLKAKINAIDASRPRS
jgi:hypothetical protein